MFRTLSIVFALLIAMTLVTACRTSPPTQTERSNLVTDADAALRQMQTTDPTLEDFLKASAAYAVFPDVGKGGLIAGGAYGRGVVYQGGKMIGYADLAQATVGAQVGGQAFSEIVILQDDSALSRFKTGKLAFAANVSAVALKSGIAKSARYTDGVAVFVKPIGGLMAEASVGGQQFTFEPLDDGR